MKYLRLFIYITAGVILTSCSDDIEPYGVGFANKGSLSVNIERVVLDDFGKATIQIRDPQKIGWNIYYEYNQDLSFSKLNGTGNASVEIAAIQENSSTSSDNVINCSLTNYRFNKRHSFAVVVPATYIDCNPYSPSFTASGNSVQVTIKSNANWTISTPSWIDATPKQGNRGSTSVRLTAKENTSTEERTDYIYFTTLVNRFKWAIEQPGAAARLSLSHNTIDFGYSYSSKTINVTTNAPSWTVSNVNYTNDANENWISYYDSHLYNQIDITAKANDHLYARSATITVSAAGKSTILTINQDAAPERLSLSKSSATFLANKYYTGTTNTYTDVTVDTNVSSWSVTSKPSWVTVTSYSSYFRIMVDAYTNTSTDREGTITVKAGSKTATITVKQKAQGKNSVDRVDYSSDKNLDN